MTEGQTIGGILLAILGCIWLTRWSIDQKLGKILVNLESIERKLSEIDHFANEIDEGESEPV